MFTEANFSQIKKFSEFNYWFVPLGQKQYSVFDKSSNEHIGNYFLGYGLELFDDSKYDKEEIEKDWTDYVTNRPEFTVGVSPKTKDINSEMAVSSYETLIIGVAFVRAYNNGVNPDSVFPKIYKTLEWLRSGDFYTAPASTIYHESEPSGLLFHTLKVVSKIHELKYVNSFNLVKIEDAVLVALVHDWCKIGLYEMYTRNQKNEETGQWEKVPAYRRKDYLLPMGHGVTSMWQASKCFKLSTEEAVAIRWHQGRWNVCDAEVNEFQQSNETYPLVHMLQFADQLAITQY